jgi:hypothetical protein
MHPALCSERDNARRASERGCADVAWDALLPGDWRGQAVAPVEFDVFREHEIAAERTLGRDEDGQPCYRAHRYVLHALRSDDDETYYLAAIYGEALTAWRLRDGRWLVHRIAGAEEGIGRGFFSLGADDPLDQRQGGCRLAR